MNDNDNNQNLNENTQQTPVEQNNNTENNNNLLSINSISNSRGNLGRNDSYYKLQAERQQKIVRGQQGYITPSWQSTPDLSFKFYNYDPKYYSKYLSDERGLMTNYGKSKMDELNAKSQPIIDGLWKFNQKLVVETVRQVGGIYESGEALFTGDYNMEDNALRKWANKMKDQFRREGSYVLSKYPDKMVGDFRGFINMIDNSAISVGSFAVQALVTGGVGGLVLKGLGLGVKSAVIAEKVFRVGTSFILTTSESADQGMEAYTKTMYKMMQQINPDTGLYYTESEAKEYSNEASKVAFWVNQTIGTALNYTGLNNLLLPEVTLREGLEKQIKSLTTEQLEKKGFKQGLDDALKNLKKMSNKELTQLGKDYGLSQYGLKRVLVEGIEEGLEEVMNQYATNVGVEYATNGMDLGKALTNKSVLEETFTTQETFWNFLGGFMGGAGQHMIIGYAPLNLNSLRQNEFVQYDSEGRPVYVTKDIKNPEEFTDIDEDIKKKIENKEVELKTIKRPNKPENGFDTEEEEKKYNEDLKEFNKRKRQELFKSKYRRAKEDYMTMFNNRASVLQDLYNQIDYNTDIIFEENQKRLNKDKTYDENKYNKAKNDLFTITADYHIKNDSDGNLKNVFEKIENLSQEEAVKTGMAVDMNDIEYKKRAKEGIEMIDDLKKEYNHINRKYWDKSNISGAKIVDVLFNTHLIAYNNKRNLKKLSEEFNTKLQEEVGNVTKQDIEEAAFYTIALQKKEKEFKNIDEITNEWKSDSILNFIKTKSPYYVSLMSKNLQEVVTEESNKIDKILSLNKDNFGKIKSTLDKYADLVKMQSELWKREIDDKVATNTYKDIKGSKSLNKIRNEINENIANNLKNKADERERKENKQEVKKTNEEATKREQEKNQKIENESNKLLKDSVKESQIKNKNKVEIILQNIENKFNTIIERNKEGKTKIDKLQLDNLNQSIINLKSKWFGVFSKDLNNLTEDNMEYVKFIEESNNTLKDIMSIIQQNVNVKIEKENIKDKNIVSKQTSSVLKGLTLSKELLDLTKEYENKKNSIIKQSEKDNDVQSGQESKIEDTDIIQSSSIDYSSNDELYSIKLKFATKITQLAKEYCKLTERSIELEKNNPDFYVEFYKAILGIEGLNPTIIREMYEDAISPLTRELQVKEHLRSIIWDKILSLDINGNTANIPPVDDTINISSEVENIKNPIVIKQNKNIINTANKLTNPSMSIAYNEREGLKVDANGKLKFIEIENIVEGRISDLVNIGDELTFQIFSDIDKIGNYNWSEEKEKLSSEEVYKYVPIAIIHKNSKEVIGFLHNQDYINDLTTVENVEEEITNLNELRKTIENNPNITTTITEIKNGILNEEKDGKINTLKSNIPHYNGEIVIFKDGKLLINRNEILEDTTNVINKGLLESLSRKTSTPFLLLPNSQKTKYFLTPVYVPKLSEIGVQFTLSTIIKKLMDKTQTNWKKGTDIQNFFSSFIYTETFDFDTLYEGDKINKRYFFTVTKEGNIRFAHINPNLINSWTIYTLYTMGDNRGKITYEEKDLTTGESIKKLLNEEYKSDILGLLDIVLSNKYLNIDLNKLNSKEKFKTYKYNDKTFNIEPIQYSNYYDFLSNYLRTNILEKTVINKQNNNEISYSYTIQPTIEFNKPNIINETIDIKENKVDKDIEEKKKETKIFNDNKKVKEAFKNTKRENEELDEDEYERSESIDYTEEELSNIEKEILNDNNFGVNYDIVLKITDAVTKQLYESINDKSVETKDDLEKEMNNLKEGYEIILENLNMILSENDAEKWKENRKSEEYKDRYSYFSNMLFSEIENQHKAIQSLLSNFEDYKELIISNLYENSIEDDTEFQHKEDELEETTIKNEWDVNIAERDTMLKSTLKLKILFNTIPICKFKIGEDNKKVIGKNGEPIIIYTLDVLGNRQLTDSLDIQQKIREIITSISSVNEDIKINTFIAALKESENASLYLLGKKLEESDDRTKASFVNVFSTQETNNVAILFRSESNIVPIKDTDEVKIEKINRVIMKKNSDNTMKSNIIKEFKRESLVYKEGNKYHIKDEKTGKTYYDINKLQKFIDRMQLSDKTRDITFEDLKEVLESVGITYTDVLFNKIYKGDGMYKNYFYKDYSPKNFNQFVGSGSILYYLLNDITSIVKFTTEDKIDLSIINPLDNINNEILNVFARVKLLANDNNYGTVTFRNGEGNMMQSYCYNTMMTRIVEKLKLESGKNNLKELRQPSSVFTGKLSEVSGENKEDYKSWWTFNLKSNNRRKFKTGQFDSLKHWSKYTDARIMPKLTNEELFVVSVLMIQNSGKDTMLISPLAFADKKTAGMLEVPKFDLKLSESEDWNDFTNRKLKLDSNGKLNINIKEIRELLFTKVLRPEIDMINRHVAKIKEGKVTSDNVGDQIYYGSFFFYFVPSLNKLTEIRNEDGSIKLDGTSINKMINVAMNDLQKMYSSNFNLFNKLFTKTTTKKDKKTGEIKSEKSITILDTLYLQRKYNFLRGKSKNVKDVSEEALKDVLKEEMGLVDKINKTDLMKDEKASEIIAMESLDYTINFMLSTFEYMKVVGSHPSESYKIKSKAGGLTKDYISTNKLDNIKNILDYLSENKDKIEGMIETVYGEHMKRMAKDIAPRIDGLWIDKRNRNFSKSIQMYIDEPKTNRYLEEYKKFGIEGFSNVEGADAQDYSSVKEFLLTQFAYSHIEDNLFNDLMTIIEDNERENKVIIEQGEKEGLSESEIIDRMKLVEIPDKYKYLFFINTTKPVTAGKVWNEDLGRYVSKYIKVATLPLLPSVFAHTEFLPLIKKMTYLESKLSQDNINKLSYGTHISMKSGVKQGAINVKDIYNYNEKTNKLKINKKIVYELKHEILDREAFGIQLEEPALEVKKFINIVTQANKLLFSELLDSNIEGFMFNDKEYNARELKDIKENIRKTMIKLESERLLNELDLKYNEKDGSIILNNKKTNNGKNISLAENVAKIILREMSSRSYTELDKLEVKLIENGKYKEFKIPLTFLSTSDKIEGLLLSTITNKVIKAKIPGKNYVNVSGNGIMTLNDTDKYKSDIVYTDKYNGESLKYVEFETDKETGKEKTIYAQCMLPFNFTDKTGKLLKIEDFMIEKQGKRYLDTNRIDENLLKLIGLRIPNQGHSSMLTLEVVGFLPSYMKGMIILPPEITKQMGSDNDNDHIYCYSYNTELTLEEKEYKENIENLKRKYSYEEYFGDEIYQKIKSSYEELTLKYLKQNLNRYLKPNLTNEETILLDKLLEEGKLLDLDSKKLSDITDDIKKGLKLKLIDYSKKFKLNKEENEEKIKNMKKVLKETREKFYNESRKEEIKKLINKEGILKKLSYNVENIKGNTLLGLQNMYVDIFHSVLSNPYVAKNMMLKTLDNDALANESKKLKTLMDKNKLFLPGSIQFKIKSYIGNQRGKVGVATQSLVSTMMALSEDKNLVFDKNVLKDFPLRFRDNNDNILQIKKLGLGRTTLENDIEISNTEINRMLQSECVDNAKNLNLDGLGYNEYTNVLYNSLVQMVTDNKRSIPMETMSRLVRQECTTLFAKELANKGSSLVEFKRLQPKEILKNISQNMLDIYNKMTKNELDHYNLWEEIRINYSLPSPQTLLNYLDNYSSNKKDSTYYLEQAKMALWLSNIYEVYIQPINSMTMTLAGIDSKSIGKTFAEVDNRKQRIEGAIENMRKIIPNIDDLLIGTELGEVFKYSFKLPTKIYLSNEVDGSGKAVYPYRSQVISSLLYKLLMDFNIDTSYIENKKLILRGFKKYMMNKALQNVIKKDEQTERKRLIYGNESLAIRTINFKDKSWYKSNPFLMQLKVELNDNKIKINKNSGKYELDTDNKSINPMIVEYEVKGKDRNKDMQYIMLLTQNIVDINKELLNDPTNIELKEKKEYFDDLILYTILESGVQNFHNWVKYIHPNYLEEIGILNTLRNFEENVDRNEIDKIALQIAKNELSLVPSVSELDGEKVNFLTVWKDKLNNSKTNYIVGLTIDNTLMTEEKETNPDKYDNLKSLMILPKIIRSYDRNKKEFMYFEKQDEDRYNGFYHYIRINPLGTELQGMEEYGPNVEDTIIKNNILVTKEDKQQIKALMGINDIIPNLSNKTIEETTNTSKFLNEPSYKTVIEILNNISSTNKELSTIVNILLQYPELFKDTQFVINNNMDKLGLNTYNKTKGITTMIEINLERISNKDEKTKDLFEKTLIHEMLHSLYLTLQYKKDNGLLIGRDLEAYSNLDVIRQKILDTNIGNNKELYEQYLLQKSKPTKEMIELFIAFENVGEMLSYIWTDENVRERANNVDGINGKKGLSEIIEVITKWLKEVAKIFNIEDNKALKDIVTESLILYKGLDNKVNKLVVYEGDNNFEILNENNNTISSTSSDINEFTSSEMIDYFTNDEINEGKTLRLFCK